MSTYDLQEFLTSILYFFSFYLFSSPTIHSELRLPSCHNNPAPEMGRELLTSKPILGIPSGIMDWPALMGLGSCKRHQTPTDWIFPSQKQVLKGLGNLSTDLQRVDQMSLSFRGRRLKQKGIEETDWFSISKPQLYPARGGLHPLILFIRFAFKGPLKDYLWV